MPEPETGEVDDEEEDEYEPEDDKNSENEEIIKSDQTVS